MSAFGEYVRKSRERHRAGDPGYSVRQLAARIGIEPSYLSKIERGQQPPPSEQSIASLARELDEDPDMLLALAGKVSSDLTEIIRRHPREMASFLRSANGLTAEQLARLERQAQKAKEK